MENECVQWVSQAGSKPLWKDEMLDYGLAAQDFQDFQMLMTGISAMLTLRDHLPGPQNPNPRPSGRRGDARLARRNQPPAERPERPQGSACRKKYMDV